MTICNKSVGGKVSPWETRLGLLTAVCQSQVLPTSLEPIRCAQPAAHRLHAARDSCECGPTQNHKCI